MSIYNQLIVRAGMPISDSIGGLKLTLIDFMCILIEGHKGILNYSLEEISIRAKKGSIIVSGKGLTLEEINAEEILIKGQIDNIKRDI